MQALLEDPNSGELEYLVLLYLRHLSYEEGFQVILLRKRAIVSLCRQVLLENEYDIAHHLL